jgi:ribonuclease HI
LLDHVNLDGRDVKIRSDSQLVINQLKGKWRVKDGNYVPYYEEAAEALQLLSHRAKSVQLYWIPREKNNEADTLSKMVSSS